MPRNPAFEIIGDIALITALNINMATPREVERIIEITDRLVREAEDAARNPDGDCWDQHIVLAGNLVRIAMEDVENASSIKTESLSDLRDKSLGYQAALMQCAAALMLLHQYDPANTQKTAQEILAENPLATWAT